MRLLVITNSRATKWHKFDLSQFLDTLGGLGELKVVELVDLASLEREFTDFAPTVAVAIGGDGTLSTTVQCVLINGFDCKVAGLPVGNANVLLRSFGYPSDPAKAAQVLVQALLNDTGSAVNSFEANWSDADGNFDNAIVLFNLGVGRDAQIVDSVAQVRQAKDGRATNIRYFKASIRALVHQFPALNAFIDGLYVPVGSSLIVSLRQPWTYVGPIPVRLTSRDRGPILQTELRTYDLRKELQIGSGIATPLQIDGEQKGKITQISLRQTRTNYWLVHP